MSLSEQLSKDAQVDLLRNQSTKPVVLNKIEITGGDFSNDFYNKLVSPALSSKSALSLSELETELISIREKLQYIGLFKDIGIKLDLDGVSRVPTLLKGEAQISENPLPLKAIVSLNEMPVFKYASYSKSTDYDVAAGFRYLNPNFSKNGDSLIVDVNINYDPFSKSINRKVWDLSYLSPTWGRSNSGKFMINPTISTVDAQKWASHQQFSAGALIGLQSLCWKTCGATVWTVGLSGSLRQVTDISNNASDLIRTYAGGDLKLGLQTHFSHDSRKYIGRFTTDGSCISFDNELSGHNSVDYSGSQQGIQLQPFFKSLVKLEGASSFLFDNFTLGYNVQAGFIKSLTEDDELHISDKFFLGGLNSLQGFHSNSVGVKSGNDYVGGLSHFKADFRLFTRLPNSRKNSPLRLYNYFNIGDVYDFNSLEQANYVYSSGNLIKKSAVATGLGLSYKTDDATLDLSYNIPLSNRSQDTAKPGLSFAVALSFK